MDTFYKPNVFLFLPEGACSQLSLHFDNVRIIPNSGVSSAGTVGEITHALDIIKESNGKYSLVSCKKLYPFNMATNQHNFSLISDICHNRLHDMEMGEIPWDDEEYDRLQSTRDKADRFFCWMKLPVHWM